MKTRERIKEQIEELKRDIEWERNFQKKMKSFREVYKSKGWTKTVSEVDEIIELSESHIASIKRDIGKFLTNLRMIY